MKLLKDILYKSGIEEVLGSTNVAVEGVTFDSRSVDAFSVFVAVRGTQVDGHDYIQSAIESGCVAIVCEELPEEPVSEVTYVKVGDTSHALAIMANNFYDEPSSKLKLIGITGTNGKTTNATLLYQLFKGLGYKCGLISTVQYLIDDEPFTATHTTPDALSLNRLMADMVEAGCTHCFMEVSSHAIVQNRTVGLHFDGAVFTNITHDHLDYHKTFDEYILAKQRLFTELPDTAFALYNSDDKHGAVMVQNSKAKRISFGLKGMAEYKAKIVDNQFNGLQLDLDNNEFWSRLVGGFNAYNLLGVYAVARMLGEDSMTVLTEMSNLQSVEGRFQYIRTEEDISGIVDYAHTPDALKNVLSTIKDIRTGNEKVITVVGCGGDRDAAKRPKMAAIACEWSDKVILTSDNPRSEDPDSIITEMQQGVDAVHHKKVLSITDRKEAIRTACALSEAGDIILVAGKGHEKYQEINGERFPFDDLEVLATALNMTKN